MPEQLSVAAATTAPDWLLVGGAAAVDPAGLGYRHLAGERGVWSLWVRGPDHRLTVVTSGRRTAVVAGFLVDPGTAEVLATGDPARTLEAEPLVLLGHYAAAVVEGDQAWTITDHSGALPVHSGSTPDHAGVVAGTHGDDVARAVGGAELDPVSAYEFVHIGVVTPPATMYLGIRAQPPSSVAAWGRVEQARDAGAPPEARHWWLRRRPGPVPSTAELAEQVRARVTAHLRTLLATHPDVLVLMSGGEDSRVVAHLAKEVAPPGASVGAVTFLGRRNREWRLASAAARAMDLDIDLRLREPDHYTTDIPEWQELVGSGLDLLHLHSIGLLGSDEADLVIDGYGSDVILKGSFQPTSRRSIAGIEVGRAVPAPWPPEPPLPEHPAAAAARARQAARRAELEAVLGAALDDRSYLVVDRTWPITHFRSYSFFISNLRTRPTASPFMFGDVLDLLATVPEDAKLDRSIFHPAFGRHLGRAGWIPRTGGEIPRLGGRSWRLAAGVMRGGGEAAARVGVGKGKGGGGGPWQTDDERRTNVRATAAALDPAALDAALALAIADGTSGVAALDALPIDPAYRALQLAVWVSTRASSDEGAGDASGGAGVDREGQARASSA